MIDMGKAWSNRNRFKGLRHARELVSWDMRLSRAELDHIRQLARGPELWKRRLSFDLLHHSSIKLHRRFTLEMIDRLIPDRSPYVRWQSAIYLEGHFREKHHEEAWPLILKWGSHKNPDINAAIACVVLESLLSAHFSHYFERCLQIVESGNRRFLRTLDMCWFRLKKKRERRQFLRLSRRLECFGIMGYCDERGACRLSSPPIDD